VPPPFLRYLDSPIGIHMGTYSGRGEDFKAGVLDRFISSLYSTASSSVDPQRIGWLFDAPSPKKYPYLFPGADPGKEGRGRQNYERHHYKYPKLKINLKNIQKIGGGPPVAPGSAMKCPLKHRSVRGTSVPGNIGICWGTSVPGNFGMLPSSRE